MVPKQRRLDLGFFTRISKGEGNANVNKEFAILSEELNKESAMTFGILIYFRNCFSTFYSFNFYSFQHLIIFF
jgi:hypothetical protein